jgi:hypothetical protein
MRRTGLALIVVAILAAGVTTACDPNNQPLPIAIIQDVHDPSARCVVGITFSAAAVITSIGTAGIIAIISWGPTFFGIGQTTEACWEDSNTVYQPFEMWFTCDAVTHWTHYFSRFVDVYEYIKGLGCFAPGGGGGGAGGGGGGW